MDFIKHLLQKLFPGKFILERVAGVPGIVLSFDDGPHPLHTPIILDELSRRNIKAVFFVTGSELEKYPELGRRIIAEGHFLGNHTFEHLNVKDVNFSDYKKSIDKTEEIISRINDKDYKKLFRPPYSAFSLKLIWYVLTSNYLLFNWNIDSRDSFISDAQELLDYVVSLDFKEGDVLLFHEDYKHTVTALPEILDALRCHDYSFNKLDQKM